MLMKVKISTSLYNNMRALPAFFVKLLKSGYYKDGDALKYKYEWCFMNQDLEIKFPADNFGHQELGYCLCIIDKAESIVDAKEKVDPNMVDMYFHEASASNVDDCCKIFYCLQQNKDEKYAFVKLLWFLDKGVVCANILSEAISKCPSTVCSYIQKVLGHICICLSKKKQLVIKKFLENQNVSYDVYVPQTVIDAIQIHNLSCKKDELSLFQLVDEIVGTEYSNQPSEIERKSTNIWLQMLTWLHSEEPFCDYDKLQKIFPVVAEPIRLEIVKRYFHDVRLKNTSFNIEILKQFKDNSLNRCIWFRYATETPEDTVVLTVPLLCDSILSIYKSKGETFQTFNGILDFAMTHCNTAHPNVDLKEERFIPVCGNSFIPNESFRGFVDYQLIVKIDEKKLSDSSLLECISRILDERGKRREYPVCKYGDGSEMDKPLFAKCSREFKSKGGEKIKLDCIGYKKYKDKWLVSLNKDNVDILNSFLDKSVEEKSEEMPVDLNMISLDWFRKYIRSLPGLFEKLDNGEFLITSREKPTYINKLVEEFSVRLRMRIFPQECAVVSEKVDLFGFGVQNMDMQKAEVKRRTIDSLKKELVASKYNGSYFELAYNRSVLVKVRNLYYFKASIYDKDDSSRNEFLRPSSSTYKRYCAPLLNLINHPATGLPFFWCMGKECFQNNLVNQTLATESNWKNYSLYHLIEIIGYPKLHKTGMVYEPDVVVRSFIGLLNKAMRKFNRLKCRSCGHLMFQSNGDSGFNNYNYFCCINSKCPEGGRTVYLNYCYQCKKGLIDSRDVKRCPNGLYICPECFACCSDQLINLQIQKYIVSGNNVPGWLEKMKGRGHNNKGKYFCPYCGSKMKTNGNNYTCTSCNKTFPVKKLSYL